MLPTLYGLAHCDTCKKARAWMTANVIDYNFVDYRESPLSREQLQAAAKVIGWDKLVNRSSTTWRQLSETERTASTPSEWLSLLAEHPTLIRRPLLIDHDHVDAGFAAPRYVAHFAL